MKKKKATKAKPAATKARRQAQGKPVAINKTGVQPLGDRVLVKPLSAEEAGQTTSFGIIIPDTAKEKPEQGVVVAVGEGKWHHGMQVPLSVKVGDTIMFSKYGYDEVKAGGVEYFLVREDSILAILSK